jgi:hypothetical protein
VKLGVEGYKRLVEAAFAGAPVGESDAAYRDAYTAHPLSEAQAKLVIAIAQLAIDADHRDDDEERTLIDSLAGHVFDHAGIRGAEPVMAPVDHDELRLGNLQSYSAELRGTPAGALAYACAYALAISDLFLAPVEAAFLDGLREALDLDEERAEELAALIGSSLEP